MKSLHSVTLTALLIAGLGASAFAAQRLSKMDQAALDTFRGLISKNVLFCGQSDAFFYRVEAPDMFGRAAPVKQLLQIREPRFFVAPGRQLTPADQLNGIEWVGIAYVAGTARRLTKSVPPDADFATTIHEVGDWEDITSPYLPESFRRYFGIGLSREQGQWKYERLSRSQFQSTTTPPVDFTCEQLAPFIKR